jgi:plasmid stabilization system protein ParE
VARLTWGVAALDSLDDLSDFIARDSPANAEAFVRRIVEAVEHLARFPRLGRVVPEFQIDSVREVVFQHYRIVYRLLDDDEVVEVLDVVHGAVDVTARVREPWDIT